LDTYQKQAGLFHILSHAVRLQILNELRKRSACVCHLQAVTHRPQAYVSQQLRILRDADLVIDEKEGQNVFYRLQDEAVRRILQETMGEAESASVLTHCTCPHCIGEKV